jgi:CRP-like cAMP-binding protein
LQLTALERYGLFLEQYPNIEKHVPNYHIASYLGITQQSLSRLRAEKAKK